MSAARLGDFAGQGTVQEELLWAAAGGIVYGATATLLGQPLDTIKTKMQTDPLTGRASGRPGTLQVVRQILQTAHERTAGELTHSRPVRKVAGFYRGSLPVLCGSVIFRSVPFTVYSGVYASLEPASFFRTLDPFLGVEGRIWLSGAVAGLGRAVVENPFEVLKTQKQVRGLDYQQILKTRRLWQGLSATCSRNVVLVTLFFVLSDRLNRSSELVNFLDFRQHPFLRGCIVTSCCWLAAWPLDVIKSQLQSEVLGSRAEADAGVGRLGGLLVGAWRQRRFYRGLPAGLVRACLANGAAMSAYQMLQQLRAGADGQASAPPWDKMRPTLPRKEAPPSGQAGATATTARGPRFLLAEGSEMGAREPLRQAWQDAKLLRPLPARYTPLRCYEWPPSQVTAWTANSLADAAAKKCAAFRPSKSPGYAEHFSLMNECFGNRAFKVLPPSLSDPGRQERPSSRASAPAKVTTTASAPRRQPAEVPVARGRPRSRWQTLAEPVCNGQGHAEGHIPAFRIKGPVGPGAPGGAGSCLCCQYMAGARLYGGPDFSRSCGAQQSHTSAGTALAAALVAASPKADLDASNRDRLWLPAKAACTSSTQATLRDNAYPRAPGFTGSADDVPTQWLAAPTVPAPAEPRRELRRPSTGRPGPPALRAAQTDPGVARPAGMRTPRTVRAWQSADEALVAEVHCKDSRKINSSCLCQLNHPLFLLGSEIPGISL
ncbi:mcfL [Symbiodinium microadriaticum]|nr:mcfL [Symbiodinium microadriaticum]